MVFILMTFDTLNDPLISPVANTGLHILLPAWFLFV